MSLHLNKKSILKKTIQFGGVTFLSRILGIIREMLQARFLGVGAMSDAFIMAFKIPHFLRQIFAEGALSASFVPVFVKKVRNRELENANGLMSLSFLFFEGIVFSLCLFVMIYPELVFKVIAPGFSQEQVTYAIPFLRILFPLIFFISSSALFGGALNSLNHFVVPALGPVVINIAFITALILCLKFDLSVNFLCYGIVFGGFLQFLTHLITYLKYNLSFSRIDKKAIEAFKQILKKFIPSLLGVSIMEINLFIDVVIASFLSKGSITLLYLGGRFVNIPVGVFAVGFATVLLPQFSRCAIYAPKRLNFYVLEVTKFVSFLIIPTMLFLMFMSQPLFSIILSKKNVSASDIWQAKWILIIFSAGLVFFCLNKVLVNVFYSLHDTKAPTLALGLCATANFVCNVIGMKLWGAFGIAGATVTSSAILTFLLFIFLKTKHKFTFYVSNYFNFLARYFVQIFTAALLFLITYFGFFEGLKSISLYNFLNVAVWDWVIASLCALIAGGFIFFTRKLFGIKLYFLSK